MIKNKSFNDLITFSRASGGGRYNAQGKYEWLSNDVPRFDYDPVTNQPRGLLIEEQRTNLLAYSEQFDNAAWSKTRTSITPNAVTAPDGTMTADKLVEDTATGSRSFGQSQASVTAAAYTLSVYAKKGERNFIQLNLPDPGAGGAGKVGSFNLNTGALGAVQDSGLTRAITDVGGGWYRCSITYTFTGAGSSAMTCFLTATDVRVESYTGDGQSGIYIWGAQLEAGSFPTSYIPTKATFTARNSIGTYTDNQGVLRTAAADVARYDHGYVDGQWVSKGLLLEGQSTNLLHNSEHFSLAPWSSGDNIVQPNTTISPDGTLTADTVVMATNSTTPTQSASLLAATTYTLSFHFHSSTTSAFLRIRAQTASASVSAWFNTSTRAFATKNPGWTGGVVESLGGGWYRASIQYLPASGNEGPRLISIAGTTTDGGGTAGGSMVLWGAQLEAGDRPTSYIPTPAVFTSRASTKTYFDNTGVMRTAAIDTAAIDHGYIDGQWVSKGLSVEGQATNLLTYSEQFDSAKWLKSNGSTIINNAVAPDGTLTADAFIEDTTNSQHSTSQTLTLTANTTYTISVYVKAAGRPLFRLAGAFINNWSVSSPKADFDLAAGTVSGVVGVSAGIQSVGNGWYRCHLVATFGAANGSGGIVILPLLTTGSTVYTGDGTSGLYIWGAQLEAGNAPSSYIPTTSPQVTRAADVTSSAQVTRAEDTSTSSQVTRAADVASVNDLSGWYKADEGVLVAEYTPQGPRSIGGSFTLSLTKDSQNYLGIGYITPNTSSGSAYWRNGGSGAVSSQLLHSSWGGVNKYAASWGSDRVLSISANGSNVESITSTTDFPDVSKLEIFRSSGSFISSGHIKSIKYLKRRVSDDELKKLTE